MGNYLWIPNMRYFVILNYNYYIGFDFLFTGKQRPCWFCNCNIPVGTNPVDVAFNPNNRDMYVVNQVGGGNTCTVSVIDSITNQVIATIPVGIRSSDIAFNPSKYEGKLEYSIGKYERLIRATIPIKLSSSKEEVESKSCYLLLSFDLNSNVMDVIENKIMPFIGKNIKPPEIHRP